ncbi:hypothetical protein [Rhodoferax koreensis]|uniref:hypothetical protein n=1 Tax=Rhodoferax koreensis TaxID=1842727 RepID=UPI001EF60CC7|nr:hypothetical protein [Rhodoferax koreense]
MLEFHGLDFATHSTTVPISHSADERADRTHARIVTTQGRDLGRQVEIFRLDGNARRCHDAIVAHRRAGLPTLPLNSQPMFGHTRSPSGSTRTSAPNVAAVAKKSKKLLLI